MKSSLLAALLVSLAATAPLFAETVKDREGAVRADRAKMENDDRWIYNDVARGFAEAKKTGKPLLVTLRCVPCKSCMGIDATILNSTELTALLDQFVCVRVINANTLDLTLFQFDYDLSFSTLFFNGDGTVYGRFGSWQHQRDEADTTIAGYQATLAAVQGVHRGYPANKAALAGKQGGPAPFKVPVEIPSLAGKYGRELNWEGKVVQSCVHCHQIGDAFRNFYRSQEKPIPEDLIYPMPAPETVGLKLDAQAAAKVAEVLPGSPAATAGLRAGDEIVTVNGQPLVSVADFAWVLHRAPSAGALEFAVRREGKPMEVNLALAEGWRGKTDISTRVGTWPMRAMATGGLRLTELTDAEKTELKLRPENLALKLTHVGQYGPHAAAKTAGFLKDDVLIAVDGVSRRMTESELIGYLLTKYLTPQRLKATVLRGAGRVELLLPVQ